MQKSIISPTKALFLALTIVAGVMISYFWRVVHPEVLNFHEEYQLLLFTTDYFVEHALLPGGIAALIGEFITQFFYSLTLGAVILALSMLLLQLFTWLLLRRLCPGMSRMAYVLGFIPVILLHGAMGDTGVMPTYLASILVALGAALLTPKAKNDIADGEIVAIVSIISYWLSGPVAWLTVLVLITERAQRGGKTWLKGIGIVLQFFIVAIALSIKFLPYHPMRITNGLFYYRYIADLPLGAIAVPASIFLLAVVARIVAAKGFAEKFREHRLASAPAFLAAYSILLAIAAIAYVPNCYDKTVMEPMTYDYLVRAQRWDDIISRADKEAPTSPTGVCALNLALAMKGELCDKMFFYYQHGSEGLMPLFARNFTSPVTPGEVYWYLGLVNTAERFWFESMQAIPNYNKSGRLIRRIAQCNIVNGEYDVAMKYLRILSNTAFYSGWAKSQMEMLGKSKQERELQIEADPQYGQLRSFLLDENFLFSEKEVDKMCGKLFMKNPDNVLAMQYLAAFPLTMCDPQRLNAYMGVINEKRQYNPRHAQEALELMQHRGASPQNIYASYVQKGRR